MPTIKPYFATLPEYSVELAQELMARVDAWYAVLPTTWWYQRAKKGYQLRYGLPSEASPFDVSTVGVAGDDGELSQVHINVLANLVHRAVTMTCSNAPTPKPVAANGDTQSQAQTLVAASVLEYEKRDKQFDRILRQVAETAFTLTAGEFSVTWDPKGGGLYDAGVPGVDAEGNETPPVPVYNGQLQVQPFLPWDVIWNLQRRDGNHQWKMTKSFINRYDLAARFPQQEEAILRLPCDHHSVTDFQLGKGQLTNVYDSEEVPVWKLYHRPSESVEKGREVWFVDAKTILFDTGGVYGLKLPVYRMCPNEMLGTGYGSSPVGDIVALQQVLNMLMSSAITNNANNAVANVIMEKGADTSMYEAANGMNIFEMTPGGVEPKSVNFTHTAPETFKLAEVVRGYMQDFLGMSDTAMGKVTGQMSGALAALLDSKSREFATLFQASFNSSVVDLGNATLDLYKRFAKTPRSLEIIVGDEQRYLLPDFTGAKIESVSRVTVEAGNAMLDTTAGRLELLDQMNKAGQVQGPVAVRGMFHLVRTGSWPEALSGPEKEEMLIKSENSQLARGMVPIVRNDDDHRAHLAGHKVLGNTPEAREDMALMAALDEHCLGHIRTLASPIPEVQALLVAMGQEPLPPLPPPGMPMLPPGAPPPGAEAGPPPPGGGGAEGPPMNGPPPAPAPQDVPGGPSMPQMPINPSTGERAPAVA